MTRIVISAELAEQLRSAKEPIELVDSNGQVLLQVLSPEPGVPFQTVPPLSEQEIQRRMAAPRYTTAQVLERLQKLHTFA